MISTVATQHAGEAGWHLSPRKVLFAFSSLFSFTPTDHKHPSNEMWPFRN